MASEQCVEVFVPADPQYTRPYVRISRPDGTAAWFAWNTESQWIELAGHPTFPLRNVTDEIMAVQFAEQQRPSQAGGEEGEG